jgi:hypothetical protein
LENKAMTLHETLATIAEWEDHFQMAFCELLRKYIPIGIRSIWSSDNLSCQEQLEAIKLLNEFCHCLDNFMFSLKRQEVSIQELGEHAKSYAKMNKVTKDEIATIMRHSYEKTACEVKTSKS